MKFFAFLKQIKNRRLVIPALAVLFAVIFGGGIYGLARTGKLNLKYFADSSYGSVRITFTGSVPYGGGMELFRNGVTLPTPQGSFSGNTYIIPSLENGNYEFRWSMPANGVCTGPWQNLYHYGSMSKVGYHMVCSGNPPPTGVYFLEGRVLNSSENNKPIPYATVHYAGDPSKFDITDAQGNYRIDNIPFDSPENRPRHTFVYSSVGFNTKNLELQNGLHQNPNAIQPNEGYSGVNVGLDKIINKYKFTGNVTANGSLLGGVSVKAVNRVNGVDGPDLVKTDTLSTGTYSGKNYLTGLVPITDLEQVWLVFSASGYLVEQRKLTEVSPRTIINQSIDSAGDTTLTIADVNLSSASLDLYYRIKTNCTDVAKCPNQYGSTLQDNTHLVDKISIISNITPLQHSDRSFTPAGYSGVFKNLPNSQREFFINSPNNAGYQFSYVSKTIKITPGLEKSETIAGIGQVKVVDILLEMSQDGQRQSDLMDVQGIVKEPKDNGFAPIKDVRITLRCKDDPDCSKFGTGRSQQSKDTFQTNNNSENNFIYKSVYNIAKSGSEIDYLELVVAKEGYYLDANENRQKDPEENGIIRVERSEVKSPITSDSRSFVKKSFVMRTLASSGIRVYGDIKNTSGNFHPSDVKIVPVNSNGTLNYAASIQPDSTAIINGKYDFTSLSGKVRRGAHYWLVVNPQSLRGVNYEAQMIEIRFDYSPVLKIDFVVAVDSGLHTFKGFVQQYDNYGRAFNIRNAEVQVNKDDFLMHEVVASSSDQAQEDAYHYKVEIADPDLFDQRDANGTKANVDLVGFNGPAGAHTKHKSYQFELEKGRGILIRCDFKFFEGDPSDEFAGSRDIKITIQKQTQEWKSLNSMAPRLIKSAPIPYEGVRVSIISTRSDSGRDTAGYQISAGPFTTGRTGNVMFQGIPNGSAKILVELPSGDASIYSLVGNGSQLTLGASSTEKTLTYTRSSWDTERLKQVKEEIEMQQCDPGWGGYPVNSFQSDSNGDGKGDLCASGCCLTSLSMAIKFYYPNKTDYAGRLPKQGIDPSVFAKIANETGITALFQANGFPQLVDQLNKRHKTAISTTSIATSQIDDYLRSGIPVVVHGNITKPDHKSRHAAHCVLLVGMSGENFMVVNPYSSPAIYNLTRSELGTLNIAFSVTTSESRAYYASTRGRVSSRGRVLAAETADGNDLAKRDSNYAISTTIKSNTIVPIEETYLVYKRPGVRDYYFKMNKNNDDFSYTIPKHFISNNFSYSFKSLDSFGVSIDSPDYAVNVENSAITPPAYGERIWSSLLFWTVDARQNSTYTSAQLSARLTSLYTQFRTSFDEYLRKMGIGSSQLVSIRGEVVNGSGSRMTNVIVKIWNDAALSSNGTFTVPKVKKGAVMVEVYNQKTGERYTVATPTLQVSKSIVGLKIVVEDPLDVGNIRSAVHLNNVAQPSDNNTLRVGTIKLYRNGQVAASKSLETTNGRFDVEGLQVGTYEIKYFNISGKEVRVFANGGANLITIRKGETVSPRITVDATSSIVIKFTSPYSNSGPKGSCDQYWWGNMAITYVGGYVSNLTTPPDNCQLSVSAVPGRINFQFRDNYGYNRVLRPSFIEIPPSQVGTVYEISF